MAMSLVWMQQSLGVTEQAQTNQPVDQAGGQHHGDDHLVDLYSKLCLNPYLHQSPWY